MANAGVDTALSNTESLTSLVTLIGRPARLPGGEVTATIRAGYAWSDIASSDTRSATGPVSLRRGDLNGALNLGLPITSRRENFGAGLGDLSANFSVGLNHLSDFGSVSVVPNRFMLSGNAANEVAFVLDPEYAAVSYLRPFQTNELAKNGDSDRTQLLVEYTLEVRNEAAHGIAADLS